MNTNQRNLLLMSLSFILVFTFVLIDFNNEVLASTQETNPGGSVTYENIPQADYEATVEIGEGHREVTTERVSHGTQLSISGSSEETISFQELIDDLNLNSDQKIIELQKVSNYAISTEGFENIEGRSLTRGFGVNLDDMAGLRHQPHYNGDVIEIGEKRGKSKTLGIDKEDLPTNVRFFLYTSGGTDYDKFALRSSTSFHFRVSEFSYNWN